MDIDHRAVRTTGDGTTKVVHTSPPRSQLHYHGMFFRILTLLLTLVAIIVTAVDNQTKSVSLSISDDIPPLQIPVTAKWHYISSNVYFLVANAIACAYAAGSLLYSTAIRTQKHQEKVGYLVIIVLDVVIMGLLLSANGAVAGVGVIAQYGNSHTRWTRVCNVFGHFCHTMAAAVAASLLASFVFLWIVMIALLNLHKMIKSLHQI